jgi:hypothetical protein
MIMVMNICMQLIMNTYMHLSIHIRTTQTMPMNIHTRMTMHTTG